MKAQAPSQETIPRQRRPAPYDNQPMQPRTHTKTVAPQGAGTAALMTQAADVSATPSNLEERREFTACAIKLLMDLIAAIRKGQDPALVILDGLAALLALYHGQ